MRRTEIVMSFFNGLKDFFMPNEDEYAEPTEPSPKKNRNSRQQLHHRLSRVLLMKAAALLIAVHLPTHRRCNPAPAPNEPPRNNRVVNIKATTQLQVVLVKPELFTDAKQIADHLMANKTVVLNLESATEANRRRIIDFLVGVAYAQNGNIKPVANQTYIVTPYNVGFVGDESWGNWKITV